MRKEYKPTSWSIDNRTSIYIFTIIVILFGIYTYNRLKKERFPEIVIPTVYVGTPYPGAPTDLENLITRPIEKRIKAVSGVKKVTSTSVQDFSSIVVEFNTGVEVSEAKQRVKDAIDKAKNDLPASMPQQPIVQEINFSDFPVMFVNMSGNYENDKLKKYAEAVQDRIETLKEITRVDIAGALEKEVQINVDMYRMEASKLTLGDIMRAVQSENITASAGAVRVGDMKRNIRVIGQFKNAEEIGNTIVRNMNGQPIYLKDVAEVKETYEERKSFARLENKPVITLNIIKRSGENLVDASDKVRAIVEDMQKKEPPKGLDIKITGDQSNMTRHTLNDLINTIIIGFILVTLVLMFFMGTTNALFVGLSVPISSFLAFLIMPMVGDIMGISYTLNMMVLFAFLLALGIVVDDAIVVIENTHRIFHKDRKMNIVQSAKFAAGEVFVPVLAGTLTTLAPFFPLLFWPGIIGKFMLYLPLTLILALTASLVVAFLINPVFAVSFMKREGDEVGTRKRNKGYRNTMIVLAVLALLFYMGKNVFMGNLLIIFAVLVTLNKFLFTGMIHWFQTRALPKFQNGYKKLLNAFLYVHPKKRTYRRSRWWIVRILGMLWRARRPIGVLIGMVVLFIFSIFITIVRQPKVMFFPSGEPNFIYTYISMPVGTDIRITDSVTRVIESKVYSVIGQNNPDVESVISNVAVGAGDPMTQSQNSDPSKGKVSVAFKEYQYRTGVSTRVYLDSIRKVIKGIPAADIVVDQERNGPPTGKPISIEISGDDYEVLAQLSKRTERYIDSLHIAGIEDLRSDLQEFNPEIIVDIDRERANREGISTGQIFSEIQSGVYGQLSPAKLKRAEDEFPIQVRFDEKYRQNVDALMNMIITYRDMNSGQIRQIPLSSLARATYANSLGGIKRKNLKRVVTISSNVLTGYTPNEVVDKIKNSLTGLKVPQGYEIKMTGEQEDQKETSDFLGFAGMLAIGIIFLILVTQFNSFTKPIIILTEIFFSVIGVLLGYAIFNMPFVIVMTGVGLVALAGIVVKNGILLVEFADVLRERGMRTVPAIAEAGRTRLNPVILTATAAVLGLIPLAIGLNINFYTLIAHGDPQFYLGGDSVVFWGPLAWTIIFGLSFATFLTLLVVPVMYLLNHRIRLWMKRVGALPRTHKL
jgi:multidrug efflux pump subunit AcrB